MVLPPPVQFAQSLDPNLQQAAQQHANILGTTMAALRSAVTGCADSTAEKYLLCQQNYLRYRETLDDFSPGQFQVNTVRALGFLQLCMSKPRFSKFSVEAKGWIAAVNCSKVNNTTKDRAAVPLCGCIVEPSEMRTHSTPSKLSFQGPEFF